MDATLLVGKLQHLGGASDEEKRALAALPATVRALRPQEDLVREGDKPTAVCLLLEGCCCRYTLVPSGKRQIMSFHIAGDIPDLQGLFLDVMDHSIAGIVSSKVAMIPHGAMCDLIDHHPRIAHVLWRDSLIDAAIFRQWMVGIGRRSAFARIAHMVCEFVLRMRAVGLSDGRTCPLPLTQIDLADALGLTPVHVSRTLTELRNRGVLRWEKGVATIPDWGALQAAGEFDPSYLQLKSPA